MAQVGTFIAKTRTGVTDFLDGLDSLNNALSMYNALGGSSFIDNFFLDSEGNPRTDLDFTKDDLLSALSSVAAINTKMAEGHSTNLNKLRQ